MKSLWKVVLPVLLVSVSLTAKAQQVKTWICTASSAGGVTNNLAANQVLEILSAAYEPDTEITVTRQNDELRLVNGAANLSVPFLIAGPAVVVFRKTATGGTGTMISYRITTQR